MQRPKPRVYFEEWDEPMTASAGLELIELGGRRIAERARSPRRNADRGRSAVPDIIIGSWCGKHFRPHRRPAGLGDILPCATAACTKSSRQSS